VIVNIGIFIRYLLFWYSVMLLARSGFWFINADLFRVYDLSVLFQSFVSGFRLDIATVCYVSVIPFLMWLVAHFVQYKNWLNRTLKIYNACILTLVLGIAMADAVLYEAWGQKLNAYASSFAKFPSDMMVFISHIAYLKIIAVLIVQVLLAWFIYHKGMTGLVKIKQTNKWLLFPVAVLMLGIIFVLIRGGVGKSTINVSSAFYAPVPALNHLAVNASWHFISTLTEDVNTTHNPYALLPIDEAEQIVNKLFDLSVDTSMIQITEVNKPNIIIIMMESWAADVIEPIGGDSGVTPRFNEWCKNGILFTNFYANGNRTDKGLAAIISAQPSMAKQSIVNHMDKFMSLPSLGKELKKYEYNSSFIYGGDASFANMKAYLMSAGINEVNDISNMGFTTQTAGWGVHDDLLFSYALDKLNQTSRPFFTTILTLSSHEPFNVPFHGKFEGNDMPDAYRNAVQFSDNELGKFLDKAKHQQWYDESIIIVVADHAHQWPYKRIVYEPQSFHIPMLITGGAIKKEWRGKRMVNYANQTDIAYSILRQLGIKQNPFSWSRNMFDTLQPRDAFYTYNNGTGMVGDKVKFVFDQEVGQVIWPKELDTVNIKFAIKKPKAYQQVYYQEYMER
jgi:phosphoglycerol transferase MdoB-like AlkP superfamily enzyme